MNNNGYFESPQNQNQGNGQQQNPYGAQQQNQYGVSQQNPYGAQQNPYDNYQNQYGASQQNFKPKKNGIRTLILIIAIVLLLCCGCVGVIISVFVKVAQPKEAINMDKFTSTMEEMGYIWESYEGSDYEFYSPDYYTYVIVDGSGEYDDESYDELIDNLGYHESNSTSNSSGSNYKTYSWRVDSDYYYSCKINDIVVVICSDSKDTINDIKDKTGL